MDAIDFAEQVAGAALTEARGTYDLLHDRAYRFITLALGGAGGAGVYALGKIGASGALIQVLPLCAVSLWWFSIALYLLLKASTSQEMKAGTTSAAIRSRIRQHTPSLEWEGANEQALALTRWEQLAAVDLQIDTYSAAASQRATVIDRAYRAFGLSFLPAALGWILALRFQ
jgi:hypothetical protein